MKQENQVDGNHVVIPCTLSDRDIKIDTHALVDCGCTEPSFMNKEFAREHNLLCYELKPPKTVEVIDGHPISCSDITKYLHIDCTIGNHHENLMAYISSLGHYPLVLRI
jgi:hypothetical protein